MFSTKKFRNPFHIFRSKILSSPIYTLHNVCGILIACYFMEQHTFLHCSQWIYPLHFKTTFTQAFLHFFKFFFTPSYFSVIACSIFRLLPFCTVYCNLLQCFTISPAQLFHIFSSMYALLICKLK